jgi:hypothetical protein
MPIFCLKQALTQNTMELEDIQKHLDKITQEQNNLKIPEFEGYSPFEMHHILHFTFSTDSPIQLQRLADPEYQEIPILNLIKYLADLIRKNGEIKLTAKGFLPTNVVSELYSQGFIKDHYLEKRRIKLYKEADSMSITLTRLLIELSGLAKKRNGKLSLTKTAGKILPNNFELLKLILTTFGSKLNWAYFDGYGENNIGQLGYRFTLMLLSKYGNEKRPDSFYADKYFNAFLKLLESIQPTYGTLEKYANNCYSLRTFEIFLNYFGIIEIEKTGKTFNADNYISKTELFDKLIKIFLHSIKDIPVRNG